MEKYEQYYLHYHRWAEHDAQLASSPRGHAMPHMPARALCTSACWCCALTALCPLRSRPCSHVTSAGHLDVAAEREVADGEGATVLNNAIMCRILPQVGLSCRAADRMRVYMGGFERGKGGASWHAIVCRIPASAALD